MHYLIFSHRFRLTLLRATLNAQISVRVCFGLFLPILYLVQPSSLHPTTNGFESLDINVCYFCQILDNLLSTYLAF